jgi:ubiquinone/menaquinone biosynthesis C-methylase UbiE
MLQVAAQKGAIREHLALATCEHLPLPTATIDLAICSFALGHLENLHCLTRELSRVTRVGADVFVSDLHPEAYKRGWRVGFRDGATALQIQVQPRSIEHIVHAFLANGFECRKHLSLWLEELEKPLFAEAGKSEFFADACQIPAVLVCHFRRCDIDPSSADFSYSPAPAEETSS